MSMAAGIFAGTIWANLLGGELLGQIGYFDGIFKSGQGMDEEERRRLWKYVLGQRLWETGLGGLLAMTPLAAAGYMLLSFGAGFVLAAIIVVFTLEKGVGGILFWLLSVFPHGLCYLGIWAIWVTAAKERKEPGRVSVWLLAAFLAAAGSFLEVWVNPILLSYL